MEGGPQNFEKEGVEKKKVSNETQKNLIHPYDQRIKIWSILVNIGTPKISLA